MTENSKLKRRVSILENQIKELKGSVSRLMKTYNEPKKEDLHELKVFRKNFCNYLGIDLSELLIKSSKRKYANYKHAFIYKAVRMYKFNYYEIGSVINLKEESVYHALRNIYNRIEKLPEFKELINDIKYIN
jgi:chromosomal replication initiation ATPase DnaA